jgi:Zn-dependent peptidase ImmA (M78 family)
MSDSTISIFDWPMHCEGELEEMVARALMKHRGVLPAEPGPISIDRLIEEMFGFNETYEDLGPGILGEIRFGIEDRPLGIRIARRLGDIDPANPSIDHERRLTLSHECGHGLAHSKLFADKLRRERDPRFKQFRTEETRIVCHERDINSGTARPAVRSSSDDWLEWEANYLMGALLLPRDLVLSFVRPWLTGRVDGIAPRRLPAGRRSFAIAATATAFQVGEEIAARRLSTLVPNSVDADFFEGTSAAGLPRRHSGDKPRRHKHSHCRANADKLWFN